ncbi:glycosyltransferase [Lysobacter enzymogenes]|uniref:glycosyltransferase n=1 Tax=Lysobacter enzymogenes TaxID=69 RepID=UPI001AF6C96A|nr:glycosyltransferase [Lysobacter enzymogenes]QQP99517.1 glycosyltransferase family 1 protein [Lysobacter enzymogenes]
MRVLLSTFGSRGDAEPLAALAAALQAQGAQARVCASPDFAQRLDQAGVELFPVGTPVRDWIREVMADPTPDIPGRGAQIMAMYRDALSVAIEDCDAVVATGLFPATTAAQMLAERHRLPYVYAGYCPTYLPSVHHAPFQFPHSPPPPADADNRERWALNARAMQDTFGDTANRHRAELGLPPTQHLRDRVFTALPWLATDPVLSPWAPTSLCEVVQTGHWILPDDRPLAPDLCAFLDAGEPPVYVGFGSMPLPAWGGSAARIAIEAVRAQGRRIVLAGGWAGLIPVDASDDCYAVGEVNQQALFPRMAAIVHHGGAGTTMAATRSGTPQVIVPQIADQPYWAGRVADLGIGVAHAGPVASVESLSAALATALMPRTRVRAEVVAGMVRGDGAAVAAKRLIDEVGGDRS